MLDFLRLLRRSTLSTQLSRIPNPFSSSTLDTLSQTLGESCDNSNTAAGWKRGLERDDFGRENRRG